MDYLLWMRDNIGYVFLSIVILVFVVKGIFVWIKKRNTKASPTQPPYPNPLYSQQQYQPQYPQQPYGNIPPMGMYDMTANMLQEKTYIEEQIKDIERESKMIADELNILDGNYQNQKTNLHTKKQACVLKYNMWKKHLDEINMKLGPQACKQAEGNRFKKLGEL